MCVIFRRRLPPVHQLDNLLPVYRNLIVTIQGKVDKQLNNRGKHFRYSYFTVGAQFYRLLTEWTTKMSTSFTSHHCSHSLRSGSTVSDYFKCRILYETIRCYTFILYIHTVFIYSILSDFFDYCSCNLASLMSSASMFVVYIKEGHYRSVAVYLPAPLKSRRKSAVSVWQSGWHEGVCRVRRVAHPKFWLYGPQCI